MADLTLHAVNVPQYPVRGDATTSITGDGFFWHDHTVSAAELRVSLAPWAHLDTPPGYHPLDNVCGFEASVNTQGNVVTDWFGSAYLARAILTFNTSVLRGYMWDSVRLGLAKSESFASDEAHRVHLVRATVASQAQRVYSDFDIRAFGSNLGVHTDRLAVSDSAATLLAAAVNVYAESGAIDQGKIPIDPNGYTNIGLLAASDITGVPTANANVTHFWGSDADNYRPYLIFVNARLMPRRAKMLGGFPNSLGV